MLPSRYSALHAEVFQVGAGGVEVAIVGHHIPLFAHRREQHFFSSPALVRGHKKLHAGDVLDDFLQPVKTARSRITFVTFHDGAPLARRHGAGAGVGEPVNQHVFGAQLEHVEFGGFQQLLALRPGGHADRLDTFDAKRLDQGFGHGVSLQDFKKTEGSTARRGVVSVISNKNQPFVPIHAANGIAAS
jgi:hypothetical protein